MKTSSIDGSFLLIILLIILMITLSGIKHQNKIRGEENYCIRTLVEEDYVEKGCDKYFLHEDWYQDYMNNIEKDYEKLERGER